jgi:glycosyltransferase involved in cell wall biosynthesis
MREVVTDGVEGLVVPVRDPEAMAGALIRLIESPDLRCKMGRAGRERVIREFTLSQQVQKWLELLEAVACSWYSGERAQ